MSLPGFAGGMRRPLPPPPPPPSDTLGYGLSWKAWAVVLFVSAAIVGLSVGIMLALFGLGVI